MKKRDFVELMDRTLTEKLSRTKNPNNVRMTMEVFIDTAVELGMLPPPPEGVHEGNAYNFMYKWEDDDES